MTLCCGRRLDGRTSSTSLSVRRSSPGRTGRGHWSSSKPAPTMPPAGLKSLSTSSRMVTAAVCQPLAASPPNIVSRAAPSSRWNGCGSNSAPNVYPRTLARCRSPDPGSGSRAFLMPARQGWWPEPEGFCLSETSTSGSGLVARPPPCILGAAKPQLPAQRAATAPRARSRRADVSGPSARPDPGASASPPGRTT
jgi:hypothetical protein